MIFALLFACAGDVAHNEGTCNGTWSEDLRFTPELYQLELCQGTSCADATGLVHEDGTVLSAACPNGYTWRLYYTVPYGTP